MTSEPAVTAAGATPFLHLFGTVAGGWFMGRLALAAQAKAESENDPTGFYGAKIILARHYARHISPAAAAYCAAVIEGSDSTLDFDPGQF